MYCNLAKYCCTPINSFWIIRQKVCLKLMFILERSGDWSTTVKCRWTWHHYAIINPASTMNRVVVRQDLYIVFRNWTKFILYSLLTIPFECCFSWPTRKRWCVCLHMTSRFYEIYIDSRNVAISFFFLGHDNTVCYFTTISINCSSKLSPFLLVLLSMTLYVLFRFTDSDNPFGIFKLLFYIHRLLFRLLTHLKDVLCLLTQDVTILRNWHSCQW